MKYILIIGDGMGDEPIAELGGKTILEAAETPCMDELAQKGEQLLIQTVPRGYPPGSDVANLSLLGYAPEKYYTGRSPLEAASMGVSLSENQTAFRCNLVNVDFSADKLIMRDYSGGHITTEEAVPLVEALQKECGDEIISFYNGISYRHLVLIKDAPAGLQTVPPHDYTSQDVTEFYNRYLKIPLFADLFARVKSVLDSHPVNIKREKEGKLPANFIWLWGEGKSPTMESLSERFGLSGPLVSAVDLLKGIGVYAGLDVPEVEGATGYIDTNYRGKVEAALSGLGRDDFAVIHLEGPDEAGHQGSLADKMQAVADLDAKVVKPVVEELSGQDFRLVICMDHFTPLSIRTHTDWPVPAILYDSRGTVNPSGLVYSEKNARDFVSSQGGSVLSGEDFFRYFIEQR